MEESKAYQEVLKLSDLNDAESATISFEKRFPKSAYLEMLYLTLMRRFVLRACTDPEHWFFIDDNDLMSLFLCVHSKVVFVRASTS